MYALSFKESWIKILLQKWFMRSEIAVDVTFSLFPFKANLGLSSFYLIFVFILTWPMFERKSSEI